MSLGAFAKTKLVRQIADHCDSNDGVIHDSNLDNLINKLRESSDCYKDASISDLFTADPFKDDSHDMIERAQIDTQKPTEYWRLTDYAVQCITPKQWFK